VAVEAGAAVDIIPLNEGSRFAHVNVLAQQLDEIVVITIANDITTHGLLDGGNRTSLFVFGIIN
jgi:hypothetical protein